MAGDYTRQQVLDIIEREANERGIPRDDFLRFAAIETGNTFDENARNPSGAKGLFQFMPGTAREFGIAGREFDPVANTDAAAQLYVRNRDSLVAGHERNGRPYLSGSAQPDGMDLYMAHQQGAAGYRSIQNAIATGEFSRSDTRGNILANIPGETDRRGNLTAGARQFEEITGTSVSAFKRMSDRDMAQTFATFWDGKFDRVRIAEKGVEPIAGGQRTQVPPGQATQRAAADSNPLADNRLTPGERGRDVSGLQQSLNALNYRDERGQPLETRSGVYGAHTAAAVKGFQESNSLPPTGIADLRTLDAIGKQLELPPEQRRRPAAVPSEPDTQARQADQPGEGRWPTPGNTSINQADKPREGRGEYGTPRGDHRHGGIDIEGRVGDPVLAYSGGTVRVQRNNGDAGNTVTIDHGGGVTTRYFHLKDISVQNGQRVEAGVEIGTMGRSGNTPQAGDTHLHFEMHRNGRKVDPLQYLQVPGREQSDRQQPRTTSPTNGSSALRQGDSGGSVRELQAQLAGLGYRGVDGKPVNPDSDFGKNTKHAVESFQRAHGLQPVDGIVGKDTFAALKQSAQLPLVSEATHPDGKFFQALKDRMPGVDDAHVGKTLSAASQAGIGGAGELQAVKVEEGNVFVMGTMTGARVKVDLTQPAPTLQQTTQQLQSTLSQEQAPTQQPQAQTR